MKISWSKQTNEKTMNGKNGSVCETYSDGGEALIAMVGGLDLMGAMDMNALERAREIGVIHFIGRSYS
jgi:hypothetical protein